MAAEIMYLIHFKFKLIDQMCTMFLGYIYICESVVSKTRITITNLHAGSSTKPKLNNAVSGKSYPEFQAAGLIPYIFSLMDFH